MSGGTGWSVVGQIADVSQITATVLGIAAVALTAAGRNPFTDPDNTTLIVTTATLALVGAIAVLTAFARNRSDNAGFSDAKRATTRTLYTVGVLLLSLALATGLFLALRPDLPITAPCTTPAPAAHP